MVQRLEMNDQFVPTDDFLLIEKIVNGADDRPVFMYALNRAND